MDTATINILISTSGSVIVGVAGMFITANQLGKRMDSLERRIDRLEDEFHAFKDVVMGKFAALDVEIAKLMDRNK